MLTILIPPPPSPSIYGWINATGTVINSVALNQVLAMNAEATTLGRISGTETGTISNNVAWNKMRVNGTAVADSDTNGTGLATEVLLTAAGWADLFKAAPWSYTEGLLPILAGLGAQDGAIPPYLVSAETQVITFALTPATATVVVKDNLDQVVAAETDGTYILFNGATYTYTVSAPDYRPVNSSVTVDYADATVTVDLEAYVYYYVGFNTMPANATVVVKDSSAQVLTAELDDTFKLIGGNTYSYTVSADGYASLLVSAFAPTESCTIDVTLTYFLQGGNDIKVLMTNPDDITVKTVTNDGYYNIINPIFAAGTKPSFTFSLYLEGNINFMNNNFRNYYMHTFNNIKVYSADAYAANGSAATVLAEWSDTEALGIEFDIIADFVQRNNGTGFPCSATFAIEAGRLAGGTYVVVFGKDVSPNGSAKLNKDVVFEFEVEGTAGVFDYQFDLVKVGDKTKYGVGDRGSVDALTSAPEAKTFGTFQMVLKYDPTLLGLDLTNSGIVDWAMSNLSKPGEVIIGCAGAGRAIDADGIKLATLVFTVLDDFEGSVTTAIEITEAEMGKPGTNGYLPTGIGEAVEIELFQVLGTVEFIEFDEYKAAPEGYKVMLFTPDADLESGKIFCFDGTKELYYSSKYEAYVAFVPVAETKEGALRKITVVDGTQVSISYTGDLNDNGNLEAIDAMMAYDFYNRVATEYEVTDLMRFEADFNGDRTVDVLDVQQILTKWITQ